MRPSALGEWAEGRRGYSFLFPLVTADEGAVIHSAISRGTDFRTHSLFLNNNWRVQRPLHVRAALRRLVAGIGHVGPDVDQAGRLVGVPLVIYVFAQRHLR